MPFVSKLKLFIWVNFYKRTLRAAKRWHSRSDEDDKFQHITEAVNYVRVAGLPPVFFEFGCHSGRTFSAAISASLYLGIELDAYAFDSFEGLPQTDKEEDGIFQRGEFATSVDDFKKIIKAKTGVKFPDTHLVKGFYENTLSGNLSNSLPSKVGFIHIDTDLYSSTVCVLKFIKNRLVNGTVILFDDWYCFAPGKNKGEKKALDEFSKQYTHIKFTPWKNYSGFGRSFFVELLE